MYMKKSGVSDVGIWFFYVDMRHSKTLWYVAIVG